MFGNQTKTKCSLRAWRKAGVEPADDPEAAAAAAASPPAAAAAAAQEAIKDQMQQLQSMSPFLNLRHCEERF